MIDTTFPHGVCYPMYCGCVLLRYLRVSICFQHSLERLTLRQASCLPLSDWLSCSAVTYCCGPCTASPTSTSSDSSCLDSILITVATNYQASPRPPGYQASSRPLHYQASKLQ
ncbi:hypothetical protein E2C01_090600 [Portunus trituberculatus]|uniref:Uncharacterized protein n=1 Tax=Portunus trituberculatus TaxID=210409 RepID=A0A5B7JBS8_PORTR|nr:hypothetical protein [Portunus trituberculatus]